jgi:hypothetical protein
MKLLTEGVVVEIAEHEATGDTHHEVKTVRKGVYIGVITGSFGAAGKFKVRFEKGVPIKYVRVGSSLYLRFKRFVFGSRKDMYQGGIEAFASEDDGISDSLEGEVGIREGEEEGDIDGVGETNRGDEEDGDIDESYSKENEVEIIDEICDKNQPELPMSTGGVSTNDITPQLVANSSSGSGSSSRRGKYLVERRQSKPAPLLFYVVVVVDV